MIDQLALDVVMMIIGALWTICGALGVYLLTDIRDTLKSQRTDIGTIKDDLHDIDKRVSAVEIKTGVV